MIVGKFIILYYINKLTTLFNPNFFTLYVCKMATTQRVGGLLILKSGIMIVICLNLTSILQYTFLTDSKQFNKI